MRRHRITPADLFRRLLAGSCAALVLALAVLAASPGAHDDLHDACSDHAQTEDGCAVVLFAAGVSLGLDHPAIVPPSLAAAEVAVASASELFLVTPRYLRQPERGPPDLG